jgi:hypothetical protein
MHALVKAPRKRWLVVDGGEAPRRNNHKIVFLAFSLRWIGFLPPSGCLLERITSGQNKLAAGNCEQQRAVCRLPIEQIREVLWLKVYARRAVKAESGK